ncbi:MAG TPA: hypothetical protein PKN48_11615 [Bacteroidales bacterium]|nr:hypothetical protein [Bacteroidales bacterium]
MKNNKFAVIIIFLVLFFVSCEGPKIFSVTVIDKDTKRPLDSVFVIVKVKAGNKEKSAYNLGGFTDASGKFTREEMIGYGLSLKRWHFYMDYNKKGYIHKTEADLTEGVVELEPLQQIDK